MEKLKFTLGNLWFWAAMIFVCFLTENMQYLSANPLNGYNPTTLIIITAGTIDCLFMYFFINHKKNKMSFDWVLLSAITTIGVAFLIGIWLAKGNTYTFEDGSNSISVSFTTYEKVRASIILVVFLVFTYAYMFCINTAKFSGRKTILLAYVGIGAAVVSIIFSFATEMKVYEAIFKNEVTSGLSIDSFYGNKNYYGSVLFIGILSCIIAIYYKPRFHWYLLMVFMYVVLLSTAAVLPSVIITFVLPIYLLEETIRFSVKRKWKYSVFTTISILLLFTLVFLFFYGSNHEWNGFKGLDVYLSEVFNRKNFSTFSGRTKIWENIIPYCIDSPISIIFGHGAIISEKHILAITAAMNNTLVGVRTTHNGYIQVMFEYGIIGLLTNVLLICYFLYSCVRLLLEKHFHFVFVHFLVVVACLVFNFCESSSFFDAGVKEIFMSVCFLMPVITKYKLSKRPERLQEVKDIPYEYKKMDYIKLGQTISIVLVSLICAVCAGLLCTYTYANTALKYTMLNTLFGLIISLVFIPYLISLFYKDNDNVTFAVHLAFNFLLIGLFLFGIFAFFKQDASTKSMLKFTLPGLLALVLLIDAVVYSIIKNASIKDWIKVFVFGGFVIPRYALLGGFVVSAIIVIVLQNVGLMNWFAYLTNYAISLVAFYLVLNFLPTKGGKEIATYLNELDLYNIKRITIMDEFYYG